MRLVAQRARHAHAIKNRVTHLVDDSSDPFSDWEGHRVALLDELRARLMPDADAYKSARNVAREAEVSLSTVQRTTAGHAPTMHVLIRLGLTVGLRLEAEPNGASVATTRCTAPSVPGSDSVLVAWHDGRWIRNDARYLAALLGAELRHIRRNQVPRHVTLDERAADLGVQPLTLQRLEHGTSSTTLATAEAAAIACGLSLRWKSLTAPWRLRPWQQPRRAVPDVNAARRQARRAHGQRAATRTALEDTWTTPPALVASVSEEFGRITLDAAARVGDAVAEHWLGSDHPELHRRDALSSLVDWVDLAGHTPHEAHIWVNPPFGRRATAFVARAVEAAKNGVPVTVLLPARVDTALWHDWVFPYASEIRHLRGRLRYGRGDKRYDSPAPFPSALLRFT